MRPADMCLVLDEIAEMVAKGDSGHTVEVIMNVAVKIVHYLTKLSSMELKGLQIKIPSRTQKLLLAKDIVYNNMPNLKTNNKYIEVHKDITLDEGRNRWNFV